MGMFDTIRSSCYLGPSFHYKNLQTKGLDCMLAEYWIDPAGRLFEIDYSGTQDFEEIPESERKSPFDSFRWVPNGSRGRVRAMNITTTIEVYPSEWNCHYAPFPRMDITFINGVLSTKQNESTWEQRYKALKRWVKEHYTNG